MKGNALATFFHGVAHGSLAYRDLQKGLEGEKYETSNVKVLLELTLGPMFWLAMMNVIHRNSSMTTKVGHAAFWSLTQKFLVPNPTYAFSFVHR